MTRKDYELIAAVMRDSKPADSQIAYCEQWSATVYRMAAVLLLENPRFDRVRFLKACGFPEGSCY